jgi:hypothetical protein
MVPPWVPDIPLASAESTPEAQTDADKEEQSASTAESPPEIPVAPPRRFQEANRDLGDYARSGNGESMRRGLGRYVRKGYGGSSTATRRMGGTVQTAQALYLALSGRGRPDVSGENLFDPALSDGKTADEVMDAVVEAVRPVDGTQDAEASRASIKDALCEMLKKYPDADLSDLQPEQREFVIERFVAGDVFRRIELDLGQTICEKAPTAAIGLSRLKDVREYVRETVSASFRKLRENGQRMSGEEITRIVQNAIQETFQVFEEYAE